jgi:hypothetical protein
MRYESAKEGDYLHGKKSSGEFQKTQTAQILGNVLIWFSRCRLLILALDLHFGAQIRGWTGQSVKNRYLGFIFRGISGF